MSPQIVIASDADEPSRQDPTLHVAGFFPRGDDPLWWPGCRRTVSPEVERAWAEKTICLKHGDPRRAYGEKILYGAPIHSATEEGCRNFPALAADWEVAVARVYQVPFGLLTGRDRERSTYAIQQSSAAGIEMDPTLSLNGNAEEDPHPLRRGCLQDESS